MHKEQNREQYGKYNAVIYQLENQWCALIWNIVCSTDHSISIRILQNVAGVQRMTRDMEKLSNKEKLEKFGLFILERRQIIGDIVNGTEKLDWELQFILSHNTRTWGPSRKLKEGQSKTSKRKYSFTQLVIRLWNSMPHCVIEANHLARFKEGLDTIWKTKISVDIIVMHRILEGDIKHPISSLKQSNS